MQTNKSKNQNTQLPNQVVADQSQLELAVSNFFNCYSVEDTENRIFRMLEEWIYDDGIKHSIRNADDVSAFTVALKNLLVLTVNADLKPSSVLAAEISNLNEIFGIAKTQVLLDTLLQSWFFSKHEAPELFDICSNVTHCHDLVKFTRVLAKEGGFLC
ncbi:MAG: hypothetical protein ACQUHE_06620 [Bacteroidia bacterium]